MKLTSILLISLTVLLIFLSCSSSKNEKILTHADEIMEEHPDSALSILETIDESSLKNDKDKAYFYLLLTQAQIKNRVQLTDDTLISISVNYYKDHGPEFNELRVNLYKSKINYNAGKYDEAIINATVAYENAMNGNDPLWKGRVSENMADLMSETLHHQVALEETKKAVDFYKEANKIDSYYFNLACMAISYGNLNDYQNAINILDSIDRETRIYDFSMNLRDYYWPVLMDIYHKMGEFQKADSVYSLIPDPFESTMAGTFYYMKVGAYIKYLTGQYDKANEILKVLEDRAGTVTDSVGILQIKAIMAYNNNDFKEAFNRLYKIFTIQNDKIIEILEDSPLQNQREYYQLKYNDEQQQNKISKIIFISVLFVCLILFIGIFIILRQRNNIKMLKVENVITELKNRLKEENDNRFWLYRNTFETLNIVGNVCYERIDDKIYDRENLKTIYKELTNLKNKKRLEEIEDDINRYSDGLVEKLREECPFLKNDDIIFIILLFAGFSSHVVSIVTGINIRYFYVKRSRLEKRITEAAPPHASLFLKYMR